MATCEVPCGTYKKLSGDFNPKKRQERELHKLSSLYGKDFTNNTSQNVPGTPSYTGKILIKPKLPRPMRIDFKLDIKMSVHPLTHVKKERPSFVKPEPLPHIVEALPALEVTFTFPPMYPYGTPPMFTLFCNWLTATQLAIVCDEMDSIAEGHQYDVVLRWAEFLNKHLLELVHIKHYICADSLLADLPQGPGPDRSVASVSGKPIGCWTFYPRSFFVFSPTPYPPFSLSDPRVRLNPHMEKAGLLRELVTSCEEAFLSIPATCEICTEWVERRIRMSGCSHAFCAKCIKCHLESQVEIGNVLDFPCLECDTGKVNSTLVHELLPLGPVAQYEKLYTKALVAESGFLAYCPRPWCNQVATVDDGVGICEGCEFAFCIHCRRTSHGINPCQLDKDLELVKKYQMSKGKERVTIEKQYGVKYLKKLEEELSARKWVSENTKPCPKCKSAIQKSEGCNKMICRHCHSVFCWLCGQKLNKETSYSHFRMETGEPCAGRLFEGNEVEMEALGWQLEDAVAFDWDAWDRGPEVAVPVVPDRRLRIVEVQVNEGKKRRTFKT